MKKLSYSADELRKILDDFRHKSDTAILDVSWDASPAELKKAWKKLAEKFHPSRFDRDSLDGEREELLEMVYQEFCEAYRRLKHESQPIELIPPPDKIGTWEDPLKKS
ncbi:hypothetical protein JXA40_09730 [bacterium]|nr:hypothetical protein [candidate division CSSED10-310 bacterium]